MAEEDERELTEEEQAKKDQDEVDRKKKRKQRILLILLALVLVSLSVGSTLALLHFLGGPRVDEGVKLVPEAQEEPFEPVKQQAIYYPLTEKLLVDYNVRGRSRILQVEISLMYRDNTLGQAIELHMPRIRNDLNSLFKGQDFEDLQTPEGKELVRQDALRQINAILEEEIGKTGVEQVLFTSFVMQ